MACFEPFESSTEILRLTSVAATGWGASMTMMEHWGDGLTLAGPIHASVLNLVPAVLPAGRERHQFGRGPFARLRMPPLPAQPGLYVWCLDGLPVYVGQTRGSLRSRLGPNGYATITNVVRQLDGATF
jgi:hypothetical protein